jgi:hypothetical protein
LPTILPASNFEASTHSARSPHLGAKPCEPVGVFRPSGNFAYFDNDTHTIQPEHIMASGALPPGFPAIEIEGEQYWDGGLVSNTPLQRGVPRQERAW